MSRHRCPRRALLRLLVALATSVPAAGARAETYHVDPVAGADVPGRDGLSPSTAWRSLTHAISRIPTDSPPPHEIRLAAGEYSAATGERFPVSIPPGVSVAGAGWDQTVLRDAGPGSLGSLRWLAGPAQAGEPASSFSDFTVVREPVGGQTVGVALELRTIDANVTMSPRLTNLVLRGASRGLDIYVESDLAAARLAPEIQACRFLENGIGVLSTAYTASGMDARSDPSFVNCVAMANRGDAIVFETGALWDLPGGLRAGATSSPVITHCTFSENLGSGILLDNSNLDERYRAGNINPRVTNSVLSGNGDYALHEYTASTDPISFDRNVVGGNLVALYRNEGQTDEFSVARLPGTGNLDATALFHRGLDPDFHLRGDSPGVDMLAFGWSPVDADLDPRPLDGNGNGVASGDPGADEALPCAVDARLEPGGVIERCSFDAPTLLSSATSSAAPSLPCAGSLEHLWYANRVLVASGTEFPVAPTTTTTYTVVVRCPDHPHCSDASSTRVVIHAPPRVDARGGMPPTPTGDYEACIEWDAADVMVDLAGSAEAPDATSDIASTRWSAAEGILFGASSLAARLAVTNTGANQVIPVTLTATNENGCSAVSNAVVRVWRGPRILTDAVISSCQAAGAPQTLIRLDGRADSPAGSIRSWLWRTDQGVFEDSRDITSRLEDPRLVLANVPSDRVARLTLTVTDDKGCSDEASITVTLLRAVTALANGPYQEPESPVTPTTLQLSGGITGPPGSTGSWTTTLGTFQSTGTQGADGSDQVIEIPNTGTDQLGQACFTAIEPDSGCVHSDCTAVAVRVTPPQPPRDIGAGLRINSLPPPAARSARLSWANPPIDADHDRAESFDVWESAAPSGGFLPRASLQDITRQAGGTRADDASLLDRGGPDLIFLLVVSENAGGSSCPDPGALLPECPSFEICDNGVDDDADRRVDCADAGCAGVPPCP